MTRINFVQISKISLSYLLLITPNFIIFNSPTCRTVIAEQSPGVDQVQLTVYPVFQKCQEIVVDSIAVPIFNTRLHSRACSPGFFLSKIPPHKVRKDKGRYEIITLVWALPKGHIFGSRHWVRLVSAMSACAQYNPEPSCPVLHALHQSLGWLETWSKFSLIHFHVDKLSWGDSFLITVACCLGIYLHEIVARWMISLVVIVLNLLDIQRRLSNLALCAGFPYDVAFYLIQF